MSKSSSRTRHLAAGGDLVARCGAGRQTPALPAAGLVRAKFPGAVAKITDDLDQLLTSAATWRALGSPAHGRPIESAFATVGRRTKVTRAGCRAAAPAMAFKIIGLAQAPAAVNASRLVALVRAAARFLNGQLAGRPDEHDLQPLKRS